MEYTTDSEFMMEQWNRINDWSMNIFEGLERKLGPMVGRILRD
jgi:hypothetical protein